ncbi:MAG: bifunctional pyr operon transcriptional regulator/uracil phosphoribosyltransferase PyrR [Desulfobacteraceae bacterium]|nr:bifunctional pyr operon transcriptional regulator/uracil phosphoribosyltransferase PyrR [Desulfobacteraceae bacterium]MBU4002750.1 bifunctional pyr operon transcriptional regulator/uracil phosphoribosyltransferase PyrR [Pseudomonadota bacterium]MBU4052955.1 bifunctional pyr operon transcriptional regulator/uracil phosphoribosyltransferase PyrR [Pseudomonadota bacterium]
MAEHKTILDKKGIEDILEIMTLDILKNHEDAQNLILIGIQTRGVHLAKRIKEHIKKIKGAEVQTGDVDITLYRDDWTKISPQPLVQSTNISFSLDGKNIILVDDVLFTGRTTRAAMGAVIDFGRPERIELAVLVDRGHRELPIQANYVGKTLETLRTDMVNVHLMEQDGEDRVILEKGETP